MNFGMQMQPSPFHFKMTFKANMRQYSVYNWTQVKKRIKTEFKKTETD